MIDCCELFVVCHALTSGWTFFVSFLCSASSSTKLKHVEVVVEFSHNVCFVTQRDPFTLYFDGVDKLYGRGTTDCLGHVAMLTFVFKALAERKPPLSRSVVALFISGEEGGETGVGIDLVVKVEFLMFVTFCPMFCSSLDVAYLVFYNSCSPEQCFRHCF
jgi:hypothetical protein